MSHDFYLKFYVQEKLRHRGLLAYEWLLELGRRQGLRGGSAFRAIAGFGRHHRLREEHFFELAGEVPIEVGFLVTDEEGQKLVETIAAENLSLFYIRIPVDAGLTRTGTPN